LTLRLREAVRAVVFDGGGRVLLVRFVFDDGPLWALPGGGIDPGESPDDAVRRELYEEIGLVDVEVGPRVWERTHVHPFAGFDGQHETVFLVHADAGTGAVVPGFSVDELAAEGLTGSRWWTLDELRDATGTLFAPRRLPELLHVLVADGPPAVVVDVGV
jgi:8-oxo-dGTP pyrophosphatase MutT (NUDIX family)